MARLNRVPETEEQSFRQGGGEGRSNGGRSWDEKKATEGERKREREESRQSRWRIGGLRRGCRFPAWCRWFAALVPSNRRSPYPTYTSSLASLLAGESILLLLSTLRSTLSHRLSPRLTVGVVCVPVSILLIWRGLWDREKERGGQSRGKHSNRLMCRPH